MGQVREVFCAKCSEAYGAECREFTCPRCGKGLEVQMDLSPLKGRSPASVLRPELPGIWRWWSFLPISDPRAIVSLQEGDTPLIRSDRLSAATGIEGLHIKNDTVLPTGSLKDRSTTVAMSRAVEVKAETVAVPSTGNGAASAAAYAAAAGLPCVVFIPASTASSKVAQAFAYGATVIPVLGNFDAVAQLFKEALEAFGWYSCLSTNPWRNEGKKSYAYEIWESLGDAPDWFIHPTAGGAGVVAAWKGFTELQELEWTRKVPRMVAAQAEAAAPVVAAYERGLDDVEPVPVRETVAESIQVGTSTLGWRALRAFRATGGRAVSVTDEEILGAQSLLARTAGVFAEPSAATSLAVAMKLRRQGAIGPHDVVVCTVTGHGLKQPDVIASRIALEPITPTLSALKERLKRGTRMGTARSDSSYPS